MKKRFLFILWIIIVICGIVAILFIFHKNNKKVLFEQYSFSNISGKNYGYVIYIDGTIQKSEKPKEIKKIDDEELRQLIQLSSEINANDYATNYSSFYGEQTSYAKIYNNKNNSYIELTYSSGNSYKYNTSEATNKILELADELYNKYLDD